MGGRILHARFPRSVPCRTGFRALLHHMHESGRRLDRVARWFASGSDPAADAPWPVGVHPRLALVRARQQARPPLRLLK